MDRAKGLKVAVFDVDGTLVEIESSWDYFHEALGTLEEGLRNAELYYSGEISYEEWAQMDASLWRGLPLAYLEELATRIGLVKGAKEAFRALKEAGIRPILLSSGLDLVVKRVAGELGVEDYVANELEVGPDGLLTGRAIVKVGLRDKLRVLKGLLDGLGLGLGDCVAVGDDESMVPIFGAVRLGVAFNPRSQEVARSAHVVVRSDDLRAILPHILKGY